MKDDPGRLLLEVLRHRPELEELSRVGSIIDRPNNLETQLWVASGWARVVAVQPCLA